MMVISLCYNKVYVWGTGVRLVYWHQKTEKEAWQPSPKVTRIELTVVKDKVGRPQVRLGSSM